MGRPINIDVERGNGSLGEIRNENEEWNCLEKETIRLNMESQSGKLNRSLVGDGQYNIDLGRIKVLVVIYD